MTIISSKAVDALPSTGAGAPPSAIQIQGEFAVDNCFQVWTGDNVSVKTHLLDINNNKLEARNKYRWQLATAKKLAPFSYIPGDYLYVIAWSDNKDWQGFIGQFYQIGASAKVYSNDPAWLVLPTGLDFGVNKSPTAAIINGFLATFPADSGIITAPGLPGWKIPTPGQKNAEAPVTPGQPPQPAKTPFDFTVTSIDAAARWVWYDSDKDVRPKYPNNPWVPFESLPPLDPQFGKNLHDEFLIFTIPLAKFINTTIDPVPPQLYAEWLFVDNRSPLAPGEQATLWSIDPAETDLDFFVTWLVMHASDVKFDANLYGLGNGVRVRQEPKTSITQEIVIPATDQEDNSIPNSKAARNAGIRYADGRIYLFPGYDVTFVVEGFVSPLTATLKQELTNAGKTISLAELLTYETRLPKDGANRPRYNPLLSALRAMGLFEAMVDRIRAHVASLFPAPDSATALRIAALATKLDNLKLNAISKIHILDTWWDLEITYPSYRTIKDNITFPGH
jgi:hypothetical protein